MGEVHENGSPRRHREHLLVENRIRMEQYDGCWYCVDEKQGGKEGTGIVHVQETLIERGVDFYRRPDIVEEEPDVGPEDYTLRVSQ